MSIKETYLSVGNTTKFFWELLVFYNIKASFFQHLFPLIHQEKREIRNLRIGGPTEFKPQKIPNPIIAFRNQP